MDTGIAVRRAGDDDLDALLQLVEQFCAVDGHDFDIPRVTAALRPLLCDDRNGQVWLLTDGPAIIGYAVATWGWSLESGGRECLIDEFYVTRPGSGLGSRLITRVIEEAGKAGATVMFLETEARNEAARRFYRRHGFTVEDSIWLSRALD